MMRLDLADLPLLYTGVFLAVVFVVWVTYARRRTAWRRAETRGYCPCRLCGEVSRVDGGGVLFRCPACGALNEKQNLNQL